MENRSRAATHLWPHFPLGGAGFCGIHSPALGFGNRPVVFWTVGLRSRSKSLKCSNATLTLFSRSEELGMAAFAGRLGFRKQGGGCTQIITCGPWAVSGLIGLG
jgi:hypothetical protein